MPPTPLPERTFTRRLASHTLAAALGAAVGSLLGFYRGQRSYAQEECVRRGMEARFFADFPQYKDKYLMPPPRELRWLMASYSAGRALSLAGPPLVPLDLLQQAAERGRQAERTLERECAEKAEWYIE